MGLHLPHGDSQGNDSMPRVRRGVGGDDAHRRLPLFLGVPRLPRGGEAEARRLLRVLLLWDSLLPPEGQRHANLWALRSVSLMQRPHPDFHCRWHPPPDAAMLRKCRRSRPCAAEPMSLSLSWPSWPQPAATRVARTRVRFPTTPPTPSA